MKKISKRLLAFFLTLITVFSSMAVPVFAMEKGDSSSVKRVWLSEFGTYSTSSPIKYGEMPMFTLNKDGTPIYCMEYVNSFNGNSVTGKDLEQVSAWTSLSDAAQLGIIRTTLYGYPNNNFGVGSRAAYAATQLVLWEYQVGWRTNPDEYISQFSSYINRNSDIKTAYNALLDKISNHRTNCDFGMSTIDLKGLGSGSAITLTDKNGVLSDFTVTSPDSNIVVSQSGNKLTIYAKKAFTNTVTLTGKKNDTVNGTNNALALTGAGQVLWYGTLDDPVQFSLRVKLSAGNIKLVKTSEDGEIAGIKFRFVGNNYDETAVTDKNGIIYLPNIIAGTYRVTEYTDDKYVDEGTKTIVVNPGQTTTVSFSNVLKKFRVQVVKTDIEKGIAQGDAKLSGAKYGIYKGDELIDTYYTDSNASFTTKYYPCGDDWTIREITPSEGYLLDNSVYPVGAKAQLYKVEYNTTSNNVVETPIKGKISLIKHNDDGSSKIETPEPGAEFQVYLKSSGSYSKSDPDERDILVTDKDGFAISKYLPYGTYIVHQTKGKEGTEFIADFEVVIDTDLKEYNYLLNDPWFYSYLKIVKTDSETDKQIAYAGAGFEIYAPNGEKVSMTYTYPTPTTIDTFYTNSEGFLITPEKLIYGKGYKLVEVQAPYGYVLDSTPIIFDITKDNSTKDNALTIVKVDKPNISQKGIIEIKKTGEVFSSVGILGGGYVDENGNETAFPITYSPIYETKNLANAVFQIYAAENIITLDGTLRAVKGELVDEITTTENGAKSKPLYLGKYIVVEKTAPDTFVNAKEEYNVELTYAGQNISVTNIDLSVYDERQKVNISLSKILTQDERFKLGMNNEILSVQFGIFADEDIKAADGSVIPKDALITYGNCDEKGKLTFNCDLPIGFKWYAKEMAVDSHYILSDIKYEFNTEYQGQDVDIINIVLNEGEPIINEPIYGMVTGLKIDRENNKTIKGALFGLFKDDEINFTADHAFLTAATNDKGIFTFENVPFGEWIVREIKPADGYLQSTDSHYIQIDSDKQIIELTVVNDKIPEIRTTATVDGKKETSSKSEITIIDIVSYEHLIPGQEYVLKGILMDKSTGKPFEVNGKVITSEVVFVPKTASGSVDVEFTFDTSSIKRTTELVVFENLFKDKIELTAHADINDEGQTITIVRPEFKSPKTGAEYMPWIGAVITFTTSATIIAVLSIIKKRRKNKATSK